MIENAINEMLGQYEYGIDLSRHNETLFRKIDWQTFAAWNCPPTKEGEQPSQPIIADCYGARHGQPKK